jgi:hypothetical protein
VGLKKHFPYLLEGRAKRPLVPFKALSARGEMNFSGLLDSGSDCSIISSEVAETLGLKLSGEVEKLTGICGCGCVNAYSSALTLDLVGKPFCCEVKITAPQFKLETIILGRNGVFDKHKISFLGDGVVIESTK